MSGPGPMDTEASSPSMLPDAVLDRPVAGLNLRARTLREELGAGATHVVFLRHFG